MWWHWPAIIVLTYAETFVAVQELRAIGTALRTKRSQPHLLVRRAVRAGGWTTLLVLLTWLGGLLIYRTDGWLGLPESVTAGIACVHSILWRKNAAWRRPTRTRSDADSTPRPGAKT